MKDKREWHRRSVSIPARCRSLDEARYIEVRLKDFHHNGCCISSPQGFAQGSRLKVAVDLPTVGNVHLTGEVCWVADSGKGFEMGVKFLVESPGDMEACTKLYTFNPADAD